MQPSILGVKPVTLRLTLRQNYYELQMSILLKYEISVVNIFQFISKVKMASKTILIS